MIATIAMAFFSLFLKERLNILYQDYSKTTLLMVVSLYFIIMTIAIVTILILAPMPIATRYMIPFYEISIVILPLYLGLLGFFKKPISQSILYILAFLLLVGAVADIASKLKNKSFHNSYYTPLAECIDDFVHKTGAKYGIATYWNAKPIYMQSETDIVLAQTHYDLQPDTKISSTSWQKSAYDFALIINNDIDKSKIIKINGQPDETFNCPKSEIIYYKNKFQTTLKDTNNSTKRI
jgi:hypothetical protein